MNWSPVRATAFRLKPGADLKSELIKLASDHHLRASAIVSAVGSLSEASLRFANCPETTVIQGKHEIVSLSGTLSQDGAHLHISISDSQGKTIGGHLMNGSTIFTTVEIVIAELSELVFQREPCTESGYDELVVKPAR